MVHRPVVHLQLDVAHLHVVPRWEAVGHLAADHALDDALLADRLGAVVVDGLDGAAVAHDGDLVGDVGDLVELVGDDDHRHALLLEAQHQIQQRLRILLVQRGGGLVQDQQLRLLGQGLGDLDQLLLAGADGLDLHLAALRQAHHLQVLVRLGVGGVPVDSVLVADLIAQVHVLTDGHLRNQRQLLVDDDDAQLLGILDVRELADLAVVDDVALVGAVGVDAAEHVHQRGLARAVFAHQRVDLALLHLEVDVVEGFHTWEGLGDVFHFQQYLCHCSPPAFQVDYNPFRGYQSWPVNRTHRFFASLTTARSKAVLGEAKDLYATACRPRPRWVRYVQMMQAG